MEEKINGLPQDAAQHIVADEPARKTKEESKEQMSEVLQSILASDSKADWEIQTNVTDGLLNFVEVHCVNKANGQTLAVVFKNRHSPVPQLVDQEDVQERRSSELRAEIFEHLFGWSVLHVDEQEFLESEDKMAYVEERLGAQGEDKERPERPERTGGRKVKRP